MSSNEIIYEQPLNELIRINLRLEQLFNQIDVLQSLDDSFQNSHLLVCYIIYVLNILDRPDLKSKFNQEFNRHIEHFSKLKNSPKISREKLDKILTQLEKANNYFFNFPGKLGSDLRDTDLISQIRLNLLSHSGGSFIDAPAYYHFLKSETAPRKETIQQWIKSFDKIQAATKLILDIVRNSSEPQTVVAEKGFYHQALNSQAPCQLIRIKLSNELNLYPEISVGKHRLSLRFLIPNLNDRSQQTGESVKFKLTCCII